MERAPVMHGRTLHVPLCTEMLLQVHMCLWDTLFAMTDTTATTNEWLIYFMVNNPDIQAKASLNTYPTRALAHVPHELQHHPHPRAATATIPARARVRTKSPPTPV